MALKRNSAILASVLSVIIGVSGAASSANASTYGIEYYIAPPFTQGSYVSPGAGVLSENFDSLTNGACSSSIGVGTVSGARCNVEPAGDYGGAGVGATVSTPTVGGSAQGKYASTDNRAMTINFSEDQRYLGLWWSAGSAGNTMTFFDGATQVLQLGTSDLRALLGADPVDGATGATWQNTGSLTSVGGSTYFKHNFFGNPRGYSSTTPTTHSSLVRWEPFVYIHIFTSGGLTFDSVVLSGTDGFEFDNLVASTQAQVPDNSLVRIGSIVSSVAPPASPGAAPTPTPTPAAVLASTGADGFGISLGLAASAVLFFIGLLAIAARIHFRISRRRAQ